MLRSIESLEPELSELAQRSQYLQAQLLETDERRHNIEEFLRLAKILGVATKPEPPKATLADVLARAASVNPDRRPLKTRIIEAAEHVLSDGKRRFSRELLPELEKLGVVIEGRDPAANLSSVLSREKMTFSSSQSAGGWTLLHLVSPRVKATSSAMDNDSLGTAFQEFCELMESLP